MATSEDAVEYREVQGHPGYRVGDDGSVWSCWQRRGLGQGNGTRVELSARWRKLAPYRIDKSGHLEVRLRKERRLVHHLVLEAFVGPRPPGTEGCHFPDRNPGNNRRGNLRWDTHAANHRDQIAHGTTNRGERNGHSVLTLEQVIAIRVAAAAGEPRENIAAYHKVSRDQVNRIVRRQRWAHVG